MGVTVFENHSKSLISKWKSTLFEFSRPKSIHLHQYISCAKIQTFYFAVQKEEILGMIHFCCDLKHCVIELLNNEVFRIWRWKKKAQIDGTEKSLRFLKYNHSHFFVWKDLNQIFCSLKAFHFPSFFFESDLTISPLASQTSLCSLTSLVFRSTSGSGSPYLGGLPLGS